MDESTKVLLPILVSPILGIVAAVITTHYKLRQERDVARDKDKEHVRLKILNPLLIASEDLLERMTNIKRRRHDPAKCEDMKRWFREVKERRGRDPSAFAFWANDEGYYAMSTLYITAVYFHYAGTIRRDFPFFELAQGGETTLLSHLSDARVSIGGKFGIWEAMQDSLGAYLARDGGLKNYREFCEMIIGEPEAVWFNRLVDFYRDIHMKLDDQLSNIERSLERLITFLRRNLQVPVFEYRLTAASMQALAQRAVPAAMVQRLASMDMPGYLDEVAFVNALVGYIGQDLADDYKPSILTCAEKRLAQQPSA
jgi:hypothetical protein